MWPHFIVDEDARSTCLESDFGETFDDHEDTQALRLAVLRPHSRHRCFCFRLGRCESPLLRGAGVLQDCRCDGGLVGGKCHGMLSSWQGGLQVVMPLYEGRASTASIVPVLPVSTSRMIHQLHRIRRVIVFDHLRADVNLRRNCGFDEKNA